MRDDGIFNDEIECLHDEGRRCFVGRSPIIFALINLSVRDRLNQQAGPGFCNRSDK
ncbi:hypothetical protein K5P26_05035 [Sphingopyxis sp. XHP0097]|jgi:hypothetical protein|uniref:Uncharacterized protein n=1 Tax=Sphingopyxis jiangsuensis TaxID=2871171 RepID=A0ABS7MBW0_9SPHN|nr:MULTISPECIES: hypothetical protein [Sphingopyxis]MBY4636503.1 hypothetical protein [Sphingopyxis jiangsuensis]